jgi:hypothetical protein
LGGYFICISEEDLVLGLASRVSENTELLIAVGSSGFVTADRLAKKIDRPVTKQKIETLQFETSRAKRQLVAENLTTVGCATLVDDVVVSGRTLEVATSVINPTPDSAAVGMFFDSADTYLRLAN